MWVARRCSLASCQWTRGGGGRAEWPRPRARGGAEGSRPGARADQGIAQLSPPRSVRGVDGASGPRDGTNSSRRFLCPGAEAASLRGAQPGTLRLRGARSLRGGRGRARQGDPHASVLSPAACRKQRGMDSRIPAAACWVSRGRVLEPTALGVDGHPCTVTSGARARGLPPARRLQRRRLTAFCVQGPRLPQLHLIASYGPRTPRERRVLAETTLYHFRLFTHK